MMAEKTFSKRKLSINVSFLNLTKQTSTQKSPKTFNDPNGVVGLQILAALNNNHDDHRHRQDSIFISGFSSISPKSPSNPIPILTTKKPFEKNLSTEEMELCEEYTCVISHAGDKSIKKIEYFEADLLGNNEGCKRVFVVSSNSGTFGGNDGGGFLSACFLCDKMLDGLDIFMYRGEKAFCSVECRYKQISIDERKEKRNRSKMRKPTDCCSVSPCSTSPMHFFTGVAAA